MHAGLAEPPEGAITGNTVPAENDANDCYEPAVAELVGLLKTHPAYSHLTDSELREKAAETVKRLQSD